MRSADACQAVGQISRSFVCDILWRLSNSFWNYPPVFSFTSRLYLQSSPASFGKWCKLPLAKKTLNCFHLRKSLAKHAVYWVIKACGWNKQQRLVISLRECLKLSGKGFLAVKQSISRHVCLVILRFAFTDLHFYSGQDVLFKLSDTVSSSQDVHSRAAYQRRKA